jgi:hypothetical protein
MHYTYQGFTDGVLGGVPRACSSVWHSACLFVYLQVPPDLAAAQLKRRMPSIGSCVAVLHVHVWFYWHMLTCTVRYCIPCVGTPGASSSAAEAADTSPADTAAAAE